MALTVGLLFILSTSVCLAEGIAVTHFGAKGDGKTNDTAAFAKALAAGKDVYVPAGEFLVDEVTLPEGTFLHGAGFASRIVVSKGKGVINVGNSCTIRDLRFTGEEKSTGQAASLQEKAIVSVRNVRNVVIDHVRVEDFKYTGIYVEHGENVKIINSDLEKLSWAILVVFSNRVTVSGNHVVDAYAHAIQFWGNWKHESMGCEDLSFTNNYVKNGGGGPIWGTGARRVIMANNIIDGATDVGLDMEWCYDGTITGNTVRNCTNAGISLFYSCKNVTIAGNSIVITDGTNGRRDGVWLTGTNTAEWKGDTGHETISITGNTIVGEGRKKHGINVGSGTNIVCAGNVLQNADVYDRTGNVKVLGEGSIQSAGRETLADTMTVIPLSQAWQFQIDPNDIGVKEKWFAVDFKDATWAGIRSDRSDAAGWELQGFGGKDGKGYIGFAWYRSAIPALPEKTRTFAYLYFPMVDEQAWVYVNGVPVGEHTEKSEGKDYGAIWDEPFLVDVSNVLDAKGKNVVAVRVHNAALNGGIRYPIHLVLSDRPCGVAELAQAVKTLAKKRP